MTVRNYNAPAGSTVQGNIRASNNVAGARPALESMTSMPYEDPRAKRCIGNDNTCKGFKTKGSDYCVGHGRAFKKDDD